MSTIVDEVGVATDRPFADHLAAARERTLMGHPVGLSLLFLVEMWERFSYYGMRAILVLYLVHVWRWNDVDANTLYGNYTMLVYLTPVLGGWLADHLIGTRRSLLIGGLIIALGHLTIALESTTSFYLGLAFIVIGTGFFKPNVSTMVGQLYRPGDHRRDAGFTIFYMGINLGAIIGPIICGFLAQNPHFREWLVSMHINPDRAWSWGFAAAGVGMLLGLLTYVLMRERYLPGIGLAPAKEAKIKTQQTTSGLMTGDEWNRVLALLLCFAFVVVFWMGYEQAGSSLNLFADRYTKLPSWLSASQIQSVPALFVVILAPVFSMIWRWLDKRGWEPSTPLKMALGLAFIASGWLFMIAASHPVDGCLATHTTSCAVTSPLWLVSFYLFSVLGELCLSPVGLSYVTKLAPVRYAALLMGAWFLANAAANKLAGSLAAAESSFSTKANYFSVLLIASAVAAALMFLLVPLLKRLTSSVKA